MASNIPDLLQVSTCGINHALRSAPLRQRRVEDVASTSHFENTHLPRVHGKNFQNKLNTSGKWTAINKPVMHEKREHITMYDPFIIGKIMLWLAPINFRSLAKRNRIGFWQQLIRFGEEKNACTSEILYNTRHEIFPVVHNCRGFFYFILFQLSTLRLRII